MLVILHVFVSSNRASTGCAAMLSKREDDRLFLYFVQSKVSHQGGGSVKWESHKQQFVCALMLVLVFVFVLVFVHVLVSCLLCRAKFCLWMLAVCEMGITL